MLENLISAGITIAIALPLAVIASAFVLPRLTPKFKADAHLQWGIKAFQQRRNDDALKQLSRAIEIAPDYAVALHLRGLVWHRLGQPERAVKDLSNAVRLSPEDALLRINCGCMKGATGDDVGAKAEYEEALRLRPNDFLPRNGLAWVLSTSNDATCRDGHRAMQLATEACDLSGWREPNCLGTLSAAQAECRNFQQAIELVERAIALGPDDDEANLRRQMLEAFRQAVPFRKCSSSIATDELPS